MRRVLHIIIICGLLFTGSLSGRSATVGTWAPDSVMLYYRSGSILLFDTYRSNANSLARMGRFVTSNRSALLSGQMHLALFGYMPSYEVGNKRAVNRASIQASVVRSFLKTQYGIPHSCFTFAIDTTQNLVDVVQLQLTPGPIPAYANTEINYSESRNPAMISAAFADYENGIPYTSYYMVLARRGDMPTGNSQLMSLGGVPIDDEPTDEVLGEQTDMQGLPLFGAKPQGTTDGYSEDQKLGLIRTEPYAPAKGTMAARDYPVVGVKTNLLYWALAMPNVELEFFMGKGFSLAFEGDYAWLSSVLGQDKAYYVWGMSAEVRYWFRQNRRFDGFYAGVYGHTGQYDLKFGHVGSQGDYYGGGLTGGYVLPLGKNFNMEFGLGLGYVQYSQTKYVWDGQKNVFDPKNPEKQTKSYIGPTKLKASLLWKF